MNEAFVDVGDASKYIYQAISDCSSQLDDPAYIENYINFAIPEFKNPANYVSIVDGVQFVWTNSNNIPLDITSIVFSIAGSLDSPDGGYILGKKIGYLYYLVYGGSLPPWYSSTNPEYEAASK